MADQIRASRDIQETGKSAARAKAEAAFSKPADTAAPPRVLTNLASDPDMQRGFSIYSSAERTYEAFQAAQRAAKTTAKSVRDKALTASVAIVASRGITKKILRKIYERSLLEPDELIAEIRAEVWGMRAAGLPVGTQLAFFDEPVASGDEALRKAYVAGRAAYSEKKTDAANPWHPSSQPGQEWLRGMADAQNDVIKGMGPKAN